METPVSRESRNRVERTRKGTPMTQQSRLPARRSPLSFAALAFAAAVCGACASGTTSPHVTGWSLADWGVGPEVRLPTATDDILGTDQWAAGPAAVGS
jgi:hypothetical protein